MNGVEFNTDNSQFELDGEIFAAQSEAIQAGLAGSTDANGTSGTATSIVYDNEIEGPVVNLIFS